MDPTKAGMMEMQESYQRLGLILNEMNRAMGLMDLMPEILVPPVGEKLQFIHQIVQKARAAFPIRSGSQQ